MLCGWFGKTIQNLTALWGFAKSAVFLFLIFDGIKGFQFGKALE